MLRDPEQDHISRIVAEMLAQELARVLRHAVSGDPHWRFEANKLLQKIDAGVLE